MSRLASPCLVHVIRRQQIRRAYLVERHGITGYYRQTVSCNCAVIRSRIRYEREDLLQHAARRVRDRLHANTRDYGQV